MAFSSWVTQFLCLLLFHFHFQATCLPSFSPNSSSSTILCSPHQSHSLLLFKKSFSIDAHASAFSSYPKTNSWMEGTDCCLWDGVACDTETGYVTGLDLSSSMLYGSIHSNNTLFSLSHLQKLDLSDNHFNGSQISSRFGYLFNLIHLNLNFSVFAGQVPSEISQLSNLVSLDLSRNDIALETNTFNKLVQNLTKLRELILNEVDMSLVAPPSFMNLSSSLSTLKLGLCGSGQIFLHFIPLSSRLVSLDLSFNHELKQDNNAFVRMVQNLSNLRELDLSSVNLSLVEPSSFFNLPFSLSSLTLMLCQLEGEFPDIFHLSKLVSLDMSGNSNLTINAIVFNKLVQSLPNLREVDLDGLNLSSAEPTNLLNLSSSLSFLSLEYCGLRGEFPANLLQRPKLQSLYLWGNEDLNGSLPMSNWSSSLQVLDLSFTKITILLQLDFFNNLKSLKELGLRGCKFVGSNLDLFGNLTQLIRLGLSHNNFSGQIPSSFQNLKQLSSLDFSHNNLSGPIPNYFANFTQLQQLVLSNNQLTSAIPSLLPSNLYYLSLSNNLLNGTIPASLFTLPHLEYLDLPNNQLDGCISQIHSNSLVRIDLRNNNLHGPIPIFQSDSLSSIDFSNNMFYGPIPNSVFDMVKLEVLILSSNNKLKGEVSFSLCNLHSLQILDLSNNSFNGFIPPCLGNLSSSLSVLHFGNNNFQGTIFNTFSESCQLRYLNFKGNQLQGRVPPSVINCKDLEFVDLSNNKIDDEFPYFLGILPHLQVLVIHSNKFHGLVKSSNASYSFPKLRIFDISNNSFNGPLPTKYFDHFEAMVHTDHVFSYMSSSKNYTYTYSVSLMFKGLEIVLPKIQNILTTIDFSQNKFTESIPHSIGKLKALKQLNISHNCLRGNISPSLSNLSNLESLDLSSNLLSGRIPMQLADLTSLAIFRVSYNRLEGPIPQGKQFGTFDKSSYEGNSGLCGFPLEKCNNGKTQHLALSKQDDSEYVSGFGWAPVLTGYGCGIIFGLGMGYLMFRTKKPTWFLRMVEGEGNQRLKGLRGRNANLMELETS